MRQRLDTARQDSDVALFHDLMGYGELVLKLSILAMVAGIDDERQGYRYQQFTNSHALRA